MVNGLVALTAECGDAYPMSKLLVIVDHYKDTHGQPSDASIARAVGIAPQTISSWRKRGIRELPARDTLVRLADFMRVPYSDVLRAVLIDIGYEEPRAEPPADPPATGEVRAG